MIVSDLARAIFVCIIPFVYTGFNIFSVSKYKVDLYIFSPFMSSYNFFTIDVIDDEKLKFSGNPYGIFRRHYSIINTYDLMNDQPVKHKSK